jgi:protocatechuate 3,4-dioxygenase beta subunit
MNRRSFSRREFGYLVFGSGVVAAGYTLAGNLVQIKALQPQKFRPTPANSLGPFYRRGAPRREKLVDGPLFGTPLLVSGRVIDTAGTPLPRAVLEVFHADVAGNYDMRGFNCRGEIPLAANGDYKYETVMPAGYGGRAQHIHYRISAPGHEVLITQLFFETDPKFAGNPDRNYSRDRLVEHRELIKPVKTIVRNGVTYRAVNFEICLA